MILLLLHDDVCHYHAITIQAALVNSPARKQDVKQQVMIDVLSRRESCQRKPGKARRTKMAGAHVVPKQTGPLDVVIAVKITAANTAGGKL